ncbi:MAG: M42 family metallopeptidase [Chloroflexi bacterium]|nr:M42 family metallopeptidase [Chloroflexota bacterium]
MDRLRALCEAIGVSGDESAVRKIVIEAVKDHVDEIRADTLGNVIAVKKGTGRGVARMMVAAHMDEVGLMIVGIDSDGTLKFEPVGGLDDRVLLGKPVVVGADRIPGVIGAKPVHLLKGPEAEQVVKMDSMRIDIGANSKESAGRRVKPGDRATFTPSFARIGNVVRGKALDDRAGCAALIEILIGKPFVFDLHAAFTVQEEIGLRGARVAAHAIDPIAAFILETTICDDLPKEDDVSPGTLLGNGPAITVMDRTAITDRRLVDHMIATAESLRLPYQFKQPGIGGTDAGAIHLARGGVPSVVISVPCRYLHAPIAMMSQADFCNEITLVRAALDRLTPAVFKRKG